MLSALSHESADNSDDESRLILTLVLWWRESTDNRSPGGKLLAMFKGVLTFVNIVISLESGLNEV